MHMRLKQHLNRQGFENYYVYYFRDLMNLNFLRLEIVMTFIINFIIEKHIKTYKNFFIFVYIFIYIVFLFCRIN